MGAEFFPELVSTWAAVTKWRQTLGLPHSTELSEKRKERGFMERGWGQNFRGKGKLGESPNVACPTNKETLRNFYTILEYS